MPTDLPYFVSKWNASSRPEESAAHDHFRDLCEVLHVPHPFERSEADDIGVSYTYEKRVTKAGTGEVGFADVWKRGFFAWEYKSKGGDLKKAYKQLNEYHEALENPPLLVVCDFVRFEVHTKFENLPSRVFAFTLDDLLRPTDTPTSALPPLDVLRHLFGDFNQLRPDRVAVPVTRAAALNFLDLAKQLELSTSLRPTPPTKTEIAHFLMRLVFCLFADSVGILPDHTFRRIIEHNRASPIAFNAILPGLFLAMSRKGSTFGPVVMPFFNGGLFDDDRTILLDYADLGILKSAAHHDWSHVEPAIFGTLFERSLDSAKRSMIGAHYTSPEDILLLIEPVVMDPLRCCWDTVRQSVLEALAQEPALNKDGRLPAALRANRPALILLQNWVAQLSRVRILDPACGSGNFLYLALKRLLDLWQEARTFGFAHGLALALEPIPSPTQLFGIEIDFYAHEIASVVVWIGFLQWRHDHGIDEPKSPVLEKLTNIQHADAILRFGDADNTFYEPTWPQADFIVGNPPFLGGKLLRRELGDSYVDNLFALYKGRVKAESDLVVYWFEKARQQLEIDQVGRAGLLATQGIRGGANRAVLERIQQIGTIFWAWSDRKWMLEGAAVHVSMVAFECKTKSAGSKSVLLKGSALAEPAAADLEIATLGAEAPYVLDGNPVAWINPDLTTGSNTATAVILPENSGLSFIGDQKGGKFELFPSEASALLATPQNPNGRPNSDVIRPWVNGSDITGRARDLSIIDFGSDTPEKDAALYEAPFERVRRLVYPIRKENRREARKVKWWLHHEPMPAMRAALEMLDRYIVTPRVSKHRVFTWVKSTTLADSAVVAIARDDDYFFGILHSKVHELWARAQGTQLREVESGFRYTPKSTFDTFPFPWSPGTEPSEAEDPRVRAIANAARTLVILRDAWLNPPDTPESELKKRTLTKLYNVHPTWLASAHHTLDGAVFTAYGWPYTLSTQQILANLLTLNNQRATAHSSFVPN